MPNLQVELQSASVAVRHASDLAVSITSTITSFLPMVSHCKIFNWAPTTIHRAFMQVVNINSIYLRVVSAMDVSTVQSVIIEMSKCNMRCKNVKVNPKKKYGRTF